MTAKEIQQDEIYAEAYKAAENAAKKKYKKLQFAAKRFVDLYDFHFGAPEKCEEYFELKKLLN